MDAASFSTFPTPGGLFPFGYTDNGGTLFWLTEGESDRWPIICMDGAYSSDYDQFELSLICFLEGWLTGRFSTARLNPPDFNPLSPPVFVSSR